MMASGRRPACCCCCRLALRADPPLPLAAAHQLARVSTLAAYVIMLAGANEVSAAAVGLVYLCAVGPSMLCKARSVCGRHLLPAASGVPTAIQACLRRQHLVQCTCCRGQQVWRAGGHVGRHFGQHPPR